MKTLLRTNFILSFNLLLNPIIRIVKDLVLKVSEKWRNYYS